jgi:hypothetical protein
MPKVMCAAVAVVVLVVPVVAGCSSSPGSPKQELIRSADDTCRKINERFTGDLAYGDGIDASDVPTLQKRVVLLKDLREQVRAMPKPETGRKNLDGWLVKLGTYITGLDDLRGQIQNYRMGMDVLLIMQSAANKKAAEAVGPAAKSFGFKDCAGTKDWEYLAS